jgi:hypothetical protein
MEFSVLRAMKGCEIWDEVEETRMMGEQEEKGQNLQDMFFRVAGGIAKGHIDQTCIGEERSQ